MNIKNNYRFVSLAICCLFALGSVNCKKYSIHPDVILMTGTETNKLVKFTVETIPSSFAVTASATGKVNEDINVSFAVDTSLVAVYNAERSANYYPAPTGSYDITGNTGTIHAGNNVSDPVVVHILSTANFVSGRTYLIPVTIKSVTGPLKVLEPSRTIF